MITSYAIPSSDFKSLLLLIFRLVPPGKKPALPFWAADSFQLFDSDVRQCFKDCFVLYSSDSTWQQAQLSLCYGCFDLCFLSHHSCAAYIASVCSSSLDTGITSNLPRHFGALFNSHALPSDAISAHSVIFQTEPDDIIWKRGDEAYHV